MIATLTLNPCIDRTVTVENFRYGETNRVTAVRSDICGKGINVSAALKNLGSETVCLGFSYKEDERRIKAFLNRLAIFHDFVEVEGSLRTNIKIFDSLTKTLTEINEKGIPVTEAAVSVIVEKTEKILDGISVLVLNGSVPPGVPEDIYRILIEKARKKGVFTVLDASGSLLQEGIKGKPYVIKPNKEELEEFFGKRFTDEKEIIAAAEQILAQGVTYVCISLGEKGAFLVSKEKALFAPALSLEVKGIQGAGDSLVAGMCMALEQRKDMETMLKYAVAAAGGSLLREGTQLCRKADFEELLKEVKIFSK